MGTICKKFQKITEEDTLQEAEEKQFYNSILADKKPYFFKYKYPALNKELNEYNKKNNEVAELHYSKSLKEILLQEKNDPESIDESEKVFLNYYHRFLPVIDSECVMNKICKYIESVDFNIKDRVRTSSDFNYKTLQTDNFTLNKNIYGEIKTIVKDTFKEWERKTKVIKQTKNTNIDKNQQKFKRELECVLLKRKLEEIVLNEFDLANYLVYLFYVDCPSYSKSTLWQIAGKQIYENIKSKNEFYYFPVKDKNGDIEYLYEKYSIRKIELKKEESVESEIFSEMSVFTEKFSPESEE